MPNMDNAAARSFNADAPKKVPRPGDKPQNPFLPELTAADILPTTLELSPEDLEEVRESGEFEVDLSDLESLQDKLEKIENAEQPPGFAMESIQAAKYLKREDQPFLDAKRKIIAAKDGLGGIAGGDVAAQTAASLLIPSVMEEKMKSATSAERPRWEAAQNLLNAEGPVDMSDEQADQAMRGFMELQDKAVAETVHSDPGILAKASERADKDLAKFIASVGVDQAKRSALAVRMLGEDARSMAPDEQYAAMQKVVRERYMESIGTTSTILKAWENKNGEKKVTVGSVGDSRVVRYRDGELERLTEDDSYVQALERIGLTIDDQDLGRAINIQEVVKAIEDFKKKADLNEDDLYYIKAAEGFVSSHHDETSVTVGEIRNKMLMNVGGSKASMSTYGLDFKPHVRTVEAKQGDLFLNLTDGVTDNIPDKFILKILKRYEGDQKMAVKMLMEAAKIVARAGLEPEVKAMKDAKKPEGEIKAKMAEVIGRKLQGIDIDWEGSFALLADWSKDDDITAVSMET